jgi:glutamine amidotransferase
MKTILVLDSGVGNLASISASLRRAGATPKTVSSTIDEDSFDGLVIPGVGSYSAAFRKVDEERSRIKKLVEQGTPVLGICLGLQLMFRGSEEGKPGEEGLCFFKGFVRRLPSSRLPHIGWNIVEVVRESRLLEGLEKGFYAYFIHSYAPLEYVDQEASGFTSYSGHKFPAVFEKDNVFGTQFHPEKSWQPGLRILSNFVNLCRR